MFGFVSKIVYESTLAENERLKTLLDFSESRVDRLTTKVNELGKENEGLKIGLTENLDIEKGFYIMQFSLIEKSKEVKESAANE